jgi:hypothetical protein
MRRMERQRLPSAITPTLNSSLCLNKVEVAIVRSYGRIGAKPNTWGRWSTTTRAVIRFGSEAHQT